MVEVNPPAYEQAGSYSAQQDRMAYAALLTPGPAVGPFSNLGGVRPDSNGLAVQALSTPGMAVQVLSGTAFVPATIPLNAGWTCHNNGTATVNIAAASASNPRIDLIIAHAYDAVDDTGTLSQWNLEAVTGTPASSPSAPAAPANSVVLANVTVPASATAITSGDIADERNWMVALGGILPATSASLPASPYPGQPVYCADTGQVLVYQGALAPYPHTWQSAAGGPGPWSSAQTFASTWSSAGSWHDYDPSVWPYLAFQVPPSGAVFVSVTAGVGNGSGSDVARIGWKLTAYGSTGTVIQANSVANSVASQDGILVRATVRNLVTGLTPGAELWAVPGQYWTAGTPQDDQNGLLFVEAVP